MNTLTSLTKLLGLATLTWIFPLTSVGTALQVDSEAYRKAKEEATRVFFDSSASKQARLAAAEKLGYPEEPVFDRMLELGSNPGVDDDIRWEALRRHYFSPKWISAILRILDNPNDGGEKLNANLVTVLSQRTVTHLPAPTRQAIQRSFRGCLNDPRDALRRNAYLALVSAEDPVAITKLVDGLRNGGKSSPVPLESAIQMLDLAGATGHFNTLRPYLDHSNPIVQAEAARVLAADANSRAAILQLIADKKTPEGVRINGLRGMSRFDDQLPRYATSIIRDSTESIPIREAAIRAVAARINHKTVADEDQIRFVEAVENFAAEPQIQAAEDGKCRDRANKVLSYLKQSSATIRHYFRTRR